MTSCDESTHVHDCIFLRTHGHTICVIEHFFHDLFNRLVLITFLTSFNEISILSETSRIEQYTFAIFIRNSTNFLDILHRNRLSTSRVIRYSYNDKRNLISMFCQYFFQFLRVKISFKRNFQLGIFCLVDRHIPSNSLTTFDVTFRRVKMRVTRYNITLFYKIREKYILGSTSLVSRDHVIESGQTGNHVFQVKERRCSSITFITQHHSGPLAICHRTGSRVGQQVNIDVFCT